MTSNASRPTETEPKTTTISLRVPERTRDMIDTAAAALGKSRTEFMLDSARRDAIDVLLDQRLLMLDGPDFEAFMDVLDDPPPANAKLKALLASKPPWRPST